MVLLTVGKPSVKPDTVIVNFADATIEEPDVVIMTRESEANPKIIANPDTLLPTKNIDVAAFTKNECG
jgi:hypothetical protein